MEALLVDVYSPLVEIFRDVFGDDEIVIDSETTVDDIEGWDSLSHVRLIMEIEKRFSIKFQRADVVRLANVGELVDLILSAKNG